MTCHWRVQIFVANPKKPKEIVDILANPISKPKLLEFLLVGAVDGSDTAARQLY